MSEDAIAHTLEAVLALFVLGVFITEIFPVLFEQLDYGLEYTLMFYLAGIVAGLAIILSVVEEWSS